MVSTVQGNRQYDRQHDQTSAFLLLQTLASLNPETVLKTRNPEIWRFRMLEKRYRLSWNFKCDVWESSTLGHILVLFSMQLNLIKAILNNIVILE